LLISTVDTKRISEEVARTWTFGKVSDSIFQKLPDFTVRADTAAWYTKAISAFAQLVCTFNESASNVIAHAVLSPR
jgi:hypothetical protein